MNDYNASIAAAYAGRELPEDCPTEFCPDCGYLWRSCQCNLAY